MRVPGCVASLDRAALDHRVTLFTCVRLDGCLTHHCLVLGLGGGSTASWGRCGGESGVASTSAGVSTTEPFGRPPPLLRGIVGYRAAAFDALQPPPPLFHITPRRRHEIGLYFRRVLTASFTICVFTVTPVDSSPRRRPCPPPSFLKNLIF